ncbi:MAG: hypothetical protein U0176_07920 [Bacteroidia bacterium]
MLNWKDYDALTFDCYGTLIDWENGILGGLMPWLRANGVQDSPEQVLRPVRYAAVEPEAEHGSFSRPLRGAETLHGWLLQHAGSP